MFIAGIIVGVIIGIAPGFLFHIFRTREARLAFESALARLDLADATIANLYAKAREMKQFDLGGTALPLATAGRIERRLVRETAPLQGAVEKAGPSSGYGGPAIQRRAQ